MRELHPLLLQHPDGQGWAAYRQPVDILETNSPGEVVPLVETLEAAARRGLTGVGFLSYEAASGFDSLLSTRPAGALPLAWFALFDQESSFELSQLAPEASYRCSNWTPSLTPESYRDSIAAIHEWIERGDTYQANFTMRMAARFEGSAAAYFRDLAQHGDSRYGAFIDTGRHAICSLSPELFFRLEGDRLTARPMKGTAARGRTTTEDSEIARRLYRSEKNRAENVMIVDMVRNDLGRVAETGTVDVERLCEIERYRTLFQMTSTCVASSRSSLSAILTALFPSASITGAPKRRTMELITGLESSPRGIYTGAIGRVGPGRSAHFNVAIRTVHIDRELGQAEYGTGGGILWDSVAEEEYRECRTKALVVTTPPPGFSLLETLRWAPASGFVLLQKHLERLEDSARYFDRPFDRARVETGLSRAVADKDIPMRVRLLLDLDGALEIESTPIERGPRGWRLALARDPIDPSDPFLFHKTTHRLLHDTARHERPDVDDVLLWNPAGEITESTVANIVIRRNGGLVTPPLESGLLAGTLRADLLERGRIHEEVIRRDELQDADAIYLINSVRGWIPARLVVCPETLATGRT